MTFLAPTALIFLAGILVPILIHFLNRFNVKSVHFSTIQFLKSMENNSIRKVKFKKWLLLLLRIGILSFMALMLSRPVTEGFIPGWLSSEIDSRLILIIDNSSSMSAQNNNVSLLHEAKKVAKELLGLYGDNTVVNIIQTCPPKILFNGKKSDVNNEDIINQIKLTSNYDNIWVTTDSLMNVMKVSEPLRECILISDFQTRSDFIDSLDKDWKYYLLDVSTVVNNLSINNLDVVSRIKVPEHLLKIKTTINNTSLRGNNSVPINLFFEDNRVGQVISNFKDEESKDFIFQAYPNIKGMLTGSIELPTDDYTNDNIWYFSSPILDKINCLIISNSDQDYRIFDLVTNAIDPNNELINLELRKQPLVNRLFIDDIDILVIHNPGTFTETAFNELDVFLKDGGGLIWFSGGMETDPVYKKYFSNLRFPSALKTIESNNGIFKIPMPQIESHFLSDLNVRKLSEELPNVFKYIQHDTNYKQKVHLELNNGDPFLIEFDRGSGKVFYFTSLLKSSWNDLIHRGLLIPLMYKLLILGGTDEVNTLSVPIGKPKWIKLNGNELRSEWEVQSPSGTMTLIVPDFINEGLKIVNTTELGIYKVYENDEIYTSFATELHPNEIISEKISKKNIESLFNELDYKWIKVDNNFFNVFSEVRHGKSLWKIFLILTLAFILLETWVGRPSGNNTKKSS